MELGKRRNKLVVKGVLYRVRVKFAQVDENIDHHGIDCIQQSQDSPLLAKFVCFTLWYGPWLREEKRIVKKEDTTCETDIRELFLLKAAPFKRFQPICFTMRSTLLLNQMSGAFEQVVRHC